MKNETDLDKLFLLSYTCIGYDGFRHSCHAWFSTEEQMKSFVRKNEESGNGIEVDLSIEVIAYRCIDI